MLTDTGSEPSDGEIKYILLVLFVVALRLFLMPLGSSLSIDETGTYWIVQGSFAEMVSRAVSWPPQSVLYCVTAWMAKQIGGAHEIILRLPSVAAIAAAVFLLVRLGTVLFDRLTGTIAAVALICMQPVAFAGADARPYALALAFSVAAMLLLVKWLEQGRLAAACAYAVFASLTVYMQPLFGVLFLVHAGYALHKLWRGRVRWRDLILTAGVVALALVPVVPELMATMRIKGTLTHLASPQVLDLVHALAPPAASFALLMGLLPFLGRADLRYRPIAMSRETLFFLASWAIVPAVLLFLASTILPTKVFAPRYILSSAPALALLLGWAIRAIEPVLARRLIVLIMAVVSLAAYGGITRLWPNHGSQNWRGAMQAVRSIAGGTGMPVLMQSGFIESVDLSQLIDPNRRGLILAPVAFYPPGADVIPLPNRMTEGALRYLIEVSTSTLERSNRFLLVICEGGTPFEAWLDGRMRARGFQSRRVGDFGEITLTMFERQ